MAGEALTRAYAGQPSSSEITSIGVPILCCEGEGHTTNTAYLNVLDADIRGFFDAIDHEWLLTFLEHRIADRRILRLIRKWLRAGVSEDGKWSRTTVGTPQGAVISPLRRRSQKGRRWTWERMARLIQRWLPKAHVLHPYPNQRLIVNYPR